MKGDDDASFKGEGRPATGSVSRARRLRRESTLAERILWSALRKLNHNFRRQVPIGRYVADFAHHESRLLIEIDGYYHCIGGAPERDAARTDWLTAEGFRVIRFAEKDVRDDVDALVARILAEIAKVSAHVKRRTKGDDHAPFPLEGGRAGDGGARADVQGPGRKSKDRAALDNQTPVDAALRPSPALPPSRGKGEEAVSNLHDGLSAPNKLLVGSGEGGAE